MIRALTVAAREVRSYIRDKRELAFSLLLPVAIFAMMYGAFGGPSLFHGTAYVVNDDPVGVYSALLLKRLGEIDSIDVEMLQSQDAEQRLAKSDIQLFVYIPPDFSKNLASGWPAQLVFRQRGNGGQEGQIVDSLVRNKVQEMSQEIQLKNQIESALGGSQEHIDITVQKFIDRDKNQPFVTVEEQTIGSTPDPVGQFLPGIITMFVLFSITLNARALVEERQNGTLERLMTTRLTLGELFAGKFLANIFRGFIQSAILLSLAYAVFRLFTPFTFAETLVVALVFSMGAGAVGLVISSIVSTEDQVSWISSLVTMANTMLGGTFFTVAEGSVLYTIGQLSLNTYANDAFRKMISRGGSLSDVTLDLGVMLFVSLAGVIVSRIFFRVIAGGR